MIYPMQPHKEIAARASTTRETVARVLSQLSSDGLVEKRDKVLYIQVKVKLQVMAEALEAGQGETAR